VGNRRFTHQIRGEADITAMSLFPKSTSFYEVTPGSEWQCDDAPSPADESSGRHSLFFGLCAAGSDWLEVVAIYILAVVQRQGIAANRARNPPMS
jgi:hypothetical protein